MKFHQLTIGAAFEYGGRRLCKSGPMTATDERGAQCMIPRYADLTPLDAGVRQPATRPAPAALAADAVVRAFESFHMAVQPCVDTAQRMRLAEARQRFYNELGISSDEALE